MKLAAKWTAEMLAVCRGKSAITEPVISAFKRDHARLSSQQKRCLERGFNRFETGVSKNCLTMAAPRSFESNAAQLAREFGFARMRMHISHRVQKLPHLFPTGLNHARVRMAGDRDSKRPG